jgi:hypothetical protein
MLASGLPEHVADDEELVRFLTSSSQFNAAGVKRAAFMPAAHRPETSVLRRRGESREALLATGREQLKGRHVHGGAIVSAADVRAVLLDVVASEPPPRHANIVGWASADPEDFKAQRMAQAASLAERAILL